MYLYVLRQISALMRVESELIITVLKKFKKKDKTNKITIIYFRESQRGARKEIFHSILCGSAVNSIAQSQYYAF